MSQEYIGFIYRITNHANGKQYIGQTNVSVDSRYAEHLRCARVDPSPKLLLYRSIKKYGEENFSVETVEIVSSLSKSELKLILNDLETYHIAKSNTYMPNGYNMTKGGYSFPEHLTRGVYVVDENGLVTDKFISMRDAQNETGVDETTIWHACNSKSHYAKGQFWYLDTSDFDVGSNIGKQSRGSTNWLGHKAYVGKPINRYTKDNIFIDTFVSASDAAKKLNICQAHISKCCLGKRKTAGGYRWSFVT